MRLRKSVIIVFILIILIVIGVSIGIHFYHEKYDYKYIEINPNSFEIEVFSTVQLSSLVTNVELKDDVLISTNSIGTQEFEIKYLKDNKRYKSNIKVTVEDNTAPVIFKSGTVTTYVGEEIDIINSIYAGDNYDNNPKREIIGEYDIDTIGTYNLTYRVTDSSDNENERDFKLVVKQKPKNTGSSTSTNTSIKHERTLFNDIVETHKNDNTMIGIDISKWQGTIDFEKVRDAGCEFVIIRLGHQKGLHGELIVDPYFKQNLENAKKAGLKVGVYLYTYSSSVEESIDQAKWALKQIGNEKLDLGISYDWESWAVFNKLNLSFYNFTKVGDSFLDYVEEKGYKGYLYSSKYYLENIWTEEKHNIWLAHYTSNTTYTGPYSIWQMCSNGKISGINGDVDIDILYLNNKK